MANPVTKNYAHFEDLKIGQVIDLGKTKITRDMIVSFAGEFDPFPFHLDEEAANASLLGGLSASGWQTGGIASKMLLENFPEKLASAGGLSFSDLKWKRPVMVNDTIGGTATITGLRRTRSNPQWGVLTLDFDVRNQNGETVMVMRLDNLVDVRNPEASLAETGA